jgi:hypothetical protein
MSVYDPIIPQPRTASATLNKALATYEDILVDALLAQHGGRNRLRLLGDEDLHRARLAIWREQVTADEWFADIPDPVLAISRVMALGMARQAVAREEERRERARQFHNVPRDPASAFVDEAIVAAIKDRLTPEEWARQINLTELRSLPGGKAVGRCPFSDHADDTPSFYTYGGNDPGWKCFGCQRHGDVIDLAIAFTGRSFRECCEGLASAAGVSWPQAEERPPVRQKSPARTSTRVVVSRARRGD